MTEFQAKVRYRDNSITTTRDVPRLARVATFKVDAGSFEEASEIIFGGMNDENWTGAIGVRSMSVGDVIDFQLPMVVSYRCEDFGWTKV